MRGRVRFPSVGKTAAGVGRRSLCPQEGHGGSRTLESRPWARAHLKARGRGHLEPGIGRVPLLGPSRPAPLDGSRSGRGGHWTRGRGTSAPQRGGWGDREGPGELPGRWRPSRQGDLWLSEWGWWWQDAGWGEVKEARSGGGVAVKRGVSERQWVL